MKFGQIGRFLQFSCYSQFKRHLIKIYVSTDNACALVPFSITLTRSKYICGSIIAALLGSSVPNALLTYNNENLEEFVRDLQLNVQDEVLTVTPDQP